MRTCIVCAVDVSALYYVLPFDATWKPLCERCYRVAYEMGRKAKMRSRL